MKSKTYWKLAFLSAMLMLVAWIAVSKFVRLLRAGQNAIRIEQSLESCLRKSNAVSLMTDGDNSRLNELVIKNLKVRDVKFKAVEIQKHGQSANVKVATDDNVEY
jgi:hypothetical protein